MSCKGCQGTGWKRGGPEGDDMDYCGDCSCFACGRAFEDPAWCVMCERREGKERVTVVDEDVNNNLRGDR